MEIVYTAPILWDEIHSDCTHLDMQSFFWPQIENIQVGKHPESFKKQNTENYTEKLSALNLQLLHPGYDETIPCGNIGLWLV